MFTVAAMAVFAHSALGEGSAGVVGGVAGHHHLTWLVGITAALGMLIAIGLWWIYVVLILLLLSPVLYGVIVWIKVLGAGEIEFT